LADHLKDSRYIYTVQEVLMQYTVIIFASMSTSSAALKHARFHFY